MTCKTSFSPDSHLTVSQDLQTAFASIDVRGAAIVPSPGHLEQHDISNILGQLRNVPTHQVVFNVREGKLSVATYPLDPESTAKLEEFATKMAQQYTQAKGRAPKSFFIIVRATADAVGVKFNDELHDHWEPGTEDSIDFIWTVQGAGPQVLANDHMTDAAVGSLALMGRKVLHGSPMSKTIRLIVLGAIDG